jgi:alkanesulfonate monooxygenase SsuD/methylene tetrahydromethanopterin reductase-like flavin-dependent oxidoreductase (luciferase family)
MLDQMTGGDRVFAYLLKGTPNEHMYYGHTADEARERAQEASLLIKKALTEPEPFAWDGKFWKFPVVSVWPGNTTKPGPVLYTSGSQQETIDFAAQNGFGMTTGGHPDYVKQMAALYQDSCRAAGWAPTPEHVLSRGICAIGESDDHAEDILGRMVPHPSVAGHAESVGSASPHDTTKPAAGGAGRPAFIFPTLLKGSPATAIEQARALAEAGIGVMDLVLDFGGLEFAEIQGNLRRLGSQVLPAIRSF